MEEKQNGLTIKKIRIIQIDLSYIKALYEADMDQNDKSRVYYNEKNPRYGDKPYIGIFTDENNVAYAIPYTSGKWWHKGYAKKDPIKGCLLTSIVNAKEINLTKGKRNKWVLRPLPPDDPYFERHPEIPEEEKSFYKERIRNFLDFERMIPLAKGSYKDYDLDIKSFNGKEMHDKMLLNDQLRLAQRNQTLMLESASKRYQRQMIEGKITSNNEPDLRILNEVRKIWEEYKEKEPRSKFEDFLVHNYKTKSIKEAIETKNKREKAKAKYDELIDNSEYFCRSENADGVETVNNKTEKNVYLE